MVVTGGSSGMGLGLAKRLSQKGGNVVIVAQNVPKLQNALRDVSVRACPEAQDFVLLTTPGLCLEFSDPTIPFHLSGPSRCNRDTEGPFRNHKVEPKLSP